MKIIDTYYSSFRFAVLVETVRYQYLITKSNNMDKPDLLKLRKRYESLHHIELDNGGLYEKI